MPQQWEPPPLTDLNLPRGGEARPSPSYPQQITRSLSRMAQALPKLTDWNCPLGTSSSERPAKMYHQQCRVSSVLTPQALLPCTLIYRKVPEGERITLPKSYPQQ